MGHAHIDPKLRTVIKKYLNEDATIEFDDINNNACKVYWINDDSLDWASLLKLNMLNIWMFVGTLNRIKGSGHGDGLFERFPGKYKWDTSSPIHDPKCDTEELYVPPVIKTLNDLNDFLCYTGNDKHIKDCIDILQTYINYPPLLQKMHLKFDIDYKNEKYTIDQWAPIKTVQVPGAYCIKGINNTAAFLKTVPFAALNYFYPMYTIPSILNPNYAYQDTVSSDECKRGIWLNKDSNGNAKYWNENVDVIPNLVYGQNFRSLLTYFQSKSGTNCPIVQTGESSKYADLTIYNSSPRSLAICDCTKSGQQIGACQFIAAKSFGVFHSDRSDVEPYFIKGYCWSIDGGKTCITNLTPYTKDGKTIVVSKENYKADTPIFGSSSACDDAHILHTNDCPEKTWAMYDPTGPGDKTGCVCTPQGPYTSCTLCCAALTKKYPTTWDKAKNPDCTQCVPIEKGTSGWIYLIGLAAMIIVLAIMIFLIRLIVQKYKSK